MFWRPLNGWYRQWVRALQCGQRYGKDALTLLEKKSPEDFSLTCGLNILTAIKPLSVNQSAVQEQQAVNAKRFDDVSINDILGGHALDEKAVKIWTQPECI